jgi:hypothetical protein
MDKNYAKSDIKHNGQQIEYLNTFFKKRYKEKIISFIICEGKFRILFSFPSAM